MMWITAFRLPHPLVLLGGAVAVAAGLTWVLAGVVLGAGLGIDAVAVVAMSAGAAMVGSAFGPTNPFQAGIALKLAQLPPLAGGGLRLAMFVAGFVLWTAWTMRYAARTR